MTSHANAAAVLCALLSLLLGGTDADEPNSEAVESLLENADKMVLADATVLLAGSVSSVYEQWSYMNYELLVTKWLLLRVPCATGVKHYIFARTEIPYTAIGTTDYPPSYSYNVKLQFSLILRMPLYQSRWTVTKSYQYLCHSMYGASCAPFVRIFYKEIPAYINVTEVTQLSKEDIVVEQLDPIFGNPLRPTNGSINKTEIASDSASSRFTGQQNEIMHVDDSHPMLLMTRWIIFRLTSITGIKHYLFTRTEGIVVYVNETAPTVIPEFTIAVKGQGPIWMASARHNLCSYDDFTYANDVCNGRKFIKEFSAEIPNYVDMSKIGKDAIIVNHIVKLVA